MKKNNNNEQKFRILRKKDGVGTTRNEAFEYPNLILVCEATKAVWVPQSFIPFIFVQDFGNFTYIEYGGHSDKFTYTEYGGQHFIEVESSVVGIMKIICFVPELEDREVLLKKVNDLLRVQSNALREVELKRDEENEAMRSNVASK